MCGAQAAGTDISWQEVLTWNGYEELLGYWWPNELAGKYAQTDAPILIAGHTGTGKEMFAHAVHSASPRASGPFVCVNCAAIPRDLLEMELFGYESGAFTGADRKGKVGKIQLAHLGTLFLDEIGELPVNA